MLQRNQRVEVVPCGDRFLVRVMGEKKRWGFFGRSRPVFVFALDTTPGYTCDTYDRVLKNCLFDTREKAEQVAKEARAVAEAMKT